MKPVKLYFILFIALLFSYSLSLADDPEVKVQSVNSSGYPVIKCNFTVTDENGIKLTQNDFGDNDITATLNGEAIDGTVFCPAETDKFSIIFVLDRSASMIEPSSTSGKTRMDIMKTAVKDFINELPQGRFEAATMAFSSNVYLLNDFTDNKDILISSLNSDLLANPAGGTDYNSAFLYDVFDMDGAVIPWDHDGALRLGVNASNPLYIIFVTDGEHLMSAGERFNIWTEDILSGKSVINAKIHTITMMDRTEITNPDVEQAILDFSDAVYWNKSTLEDLELTVMAIQEVMKSNQESEFCTYEFEANCTDGEFVLAVDNAKVQDEDTYDFVIPDAVKPLMAFEPEENSLGVFLNVMAGTNAEKTVKIGAENNFIEHYGAELSDDVNWELVSSVGGTQEKGNEQDLIIRFTPPGEEKCYPMTIEFDNSSCGTKTYTVTAGWIYPNDIDFGYTDIMSYEELTDEVQICNNTCSNVTITSIDFADNEDNNFTFFPKPELPVNLQISECIDIPILFNPLTEGNFTSHFNAEITINGINYTISSSLFGQGLSNVAVTDNSNAYDNLIKISPNPVNEHLIVNLEELNARIVDMSIINTAGATVKQVECNSEESMNIDVSELSSGVYYLCVKTEKFSAFKKFFVIK